MISGFAHIAIIFVNATYYTYYILEIMPFPTPWKGSLDSELTAKPFFTGDPQKMMDAGNIAEDVAVMIGTTKDEGMIQSTTLFHNREKFHKLHIVGCSSTS